MLLRIQHFTSAFTLTTCRDITERSTDRFQAEFARIVDLADQYINGPDVVAHSPAESTASGSEPQRSFSLEPGILPALYLICMKCRDAKTRSRALALLSGCDRREGVHWSRGLVPYAEAMMNLEKDRTCALQKYATGSEVPDEIEVPEAARFTDIVIEGLGPWHIRVFCARYRHEGGGELELVEYDGAGAPPIKLELLQQMVLPFSCSRS